MLDLTDDFEEDTDGADVGEAGSWVGPTVTYTVTGTSTVTITVAPPIGALVGLGDREPPEVELLAALVGVV